MSELDDLLKTADVVVCCGSGGVGKTTTAAALGLEAARCGRRCVVVTIDPAKRLADALGVPGGLTNDPIQLAVNGDGELWALMLDTATTFDGLVTANAASPEQATRILTNAFYRNIAGSLGGTQEYMAAERLLALHRDTRFDLVIVDTPPTRNALDFLDAPRTLARFLDHPVFKLMMMPTRRGLRVLSIAAQPLLRSIGKVIGSEVLADALAFFQAFDGMETGFRNRADEVIELLHGERTRFVLVASPRVDTIDEARFFAGRLVEKDLVVGAIIVNRATPDFGKPTGRRPRRIADAALFDNQAQLHELAVGERSQIAPLVADTDREPTWVPLLPGDVHDLEALDQIRALLFTGSMPARGRAGKVEAVHILVGTDADHVLHDVTAALGGPDVSFTVCRNGRDVSDVVEKRTPDLVVLDLQIGSMGGMAVTMALRLDESAGTLPHVNVLMLLDRQADIHLAKRCAANGYLVKPLNPLSLKRAARAILNPPPPPVGPVAEETPEEEPAPVG